MAASVRVNVKFEGNNLIIQMGSNKKYAAHQHFGSKPGGFQHPGGTPYIIKKGQAFFVKKAWAAQNENKIRGFTKPHKISLPARPFLVIQDEDIKNIRDMIARKISSKF
jgi:phage gpG-like protein